MSALPGELIAEIGASLDHADLGNLMACNWHLYGVFAPAYWQKLIVDCSNISSLLHLARQIDQGKAFDVFEFVHEVKLNRTSDATRPITLAETLQVVGKLWPVVNKLELVTPPLERELGAELRRMEKRNGTELSLHVMCDEQEPGDFSRFNNIKSLVLENVYDGIDHLMPLPQSVEFLDIRAHSTCAYSRVLGKFMSKCVAMPTLRISELSIGIDRSAAWIPDSTTRLELADCQIHVSNTVTNRPTMSGIKSLKILDDFCKVDNMVLPELESLELCKHGSFLSSVKPANVPVLSELVYSNVKLGSIVSSLHHANNTLMSGIERIALKGLGTALQDEQLVIELLQVLSAKAPRLSTLTLDVDGLVMMNNERDEFDRLLHEKVSQHLSPLVSVYATSSTGLYRVSV